MSHNIDPGVNCRLAENLTLSTALNGIYLGRDSQNGTLDPVTGKTAYQQPQTSLIDNVVNTGGKYLYVSPGIQWNVADSVSLRAAHRIPISRSANGTQIVTDGWTTASLSVSF
jgi:hypothetical protein